MGGLAQNSPSFRGDNRPIETIRQNEAEAFCAKRGARLPTETEWEYAARGPDDLIYPWGNTWDASKAVYSGNSDNQTADVGSKPGGASWVGALDMSGNVWQWTSSLYKPYPYNETDGREDQTVIGTRVARGGSWYNNFINLGTVVRGWDFHSVGLGDDWYPIVGFRCARSFGPNDALTPGFDPTAPARLIAESTVHWYEPYAHFNEFHPVSQWWGCPATPTAAYRYAQGRHAGIDFSIPEGTNLYTVTNGTVYNAGFYSYQINPVGNNSVILKVSLTLPDGSTTDGFVTYLSMLSLNVTTGQKVKAGDLIGKSDGDPTLHPPTFTGFSAGPHLHFQVAEGNFYDYPNDVDPEWFLGLGQPNEHGNIPGKGATTNCAS